MTPRIENGWLVIPYTGSDFSKLYIAVGDRDNWQPAYLDYSGGQRVAKIRVAESTAQAREVWFKVDGVVTSVGQAVI